MKIFFTGLFLMGATSFAAVDMNVSVFNDVPDPVAATNIVEYQITVENSGDEDAANASLEVDVPAGTSFVDVDDARCSFNGVSNKVECDFGILEGTQFPATGSPINIVIQLRADLAGGGGATITSTALVSNTTANPDDNPGNESISETTTIVEGSDLRLDAITATPNPVAAADTVSYGLTTTNIGPNVAADAQIIFNLPVEINYSGFSGSNWSCSEAAQVVTCNYNTSIAVSASSNPLTINGQVLASTVGTLTSSATVSGSTPDGLPDNNTGTHDLTVTAGTDLSLTKSINLDPVTAGEAIQFTLLVNNNGPMTADNVVVTDTLPADYTGISASGVGWVCTVTGQAVDCTRATQVQGTTTIVINATAPATAPLGGTTHTNSATVSSDTTDSVPGNDTGSVSYELFPDGVDFSVTKSKTPSPVAQGSDMTSTMVVSNNGPRDASATIRATDKLHVDESFVSASGSGWTCNYNAIPHEVVCDRPGPLANGASTPAITIVTNANAAGLLQNEVCASHESAPANEAEANPGNDCATATSDASSNTADLQLTKITSDTSIDTTESSFDYTLTVTNAGPDTATGITLTDIIPMYLGGTAFRPATGISVVASDGTICSTGSTVSCNLQDMANGAITTVTITVTRPFRDSSWINSASVFSSNIGDPARGNNTADAPSVAIAGVADIEMTAKTVTPTSVRAGVEATYVLSFRNSGASTADSVVVTDTFNPAGVGTYTLISTSATKGSCDPIVGDVLTCNIGFMVRNETQSVTVVIRPDYMVAPPAPRELPNIAEVSTSTAESDPGNNSQVASLAITEALLDLIVNKSDVIDPVGFDSTASPNGEIVYEIRVNNIGPSFGSNIEFTDTITTPAGKNLTFTCDRDTAAGACGVTFCNNQGLSFTGSQAFVCDLGATKELASGDSYTRYLVFEIEDAPDPGGDTYSDTVSVTSNEPESNVGNNTANETTTVRGIVDLEVVSKIPSADPVDLREPFTYAINITNNGPSDSGGINGVHIDDTNDSRVTDTLPSGMELTGTPTILPLQSDQGANNRTCTGVAGDTSFSCDLRTINAGSNLTVTVPVRIISYSATKNNSATVFSLDLDTTPANDTNSGLVNVLKSSITGIVYRDLNDNGIQDAGENGINGVSLQITGTDFYGDAVSTTVTTNSSGIYLFDNLPQSDGTGYTITETTQPVGMFDGQDSVSAVVSAGSKSTDAHSGIVLAANTALTDYLFGELPAATVSGFVWHDANNDGIKDGAETDNIAGVSVNLTGIDDQGNAVNVIVSTVANGSYQFTNLRPSDASGYSITETQPGTHLPGLATIGSGATADGTVDNNPVSANYGNIFSAIVINADDDAVNYNFGELLTSSVAGSVFNDVNNDGSQDAGETGLASVTIVLTGTDYLGNPVSITETTDVNGDYLFDNLPPSDATGYTITETQPANYQDGTITPGTLGGTAGTNVITAIVVGSAETGSDYLFAERSATLTGFVYVDKDDSATQDGGEPGIPGVSVTLSGTDENGDAVNVTVVTDANGNFIFTNIPASNGIGYTLTESQPAAWIDGQDAAGTAGGIVGNDVINGIVLTLTTNSSGYLFGEAASSLAGSVFNDTNNNGTQDGSEFPIENVTVTLTGTDILGNPVNLTTTTDANGEYNFVGLVPGTYTLTETQPVTYVDGGVTVGTSGGTAGTNVISNITLTSGVDGTGYNFAERSAEISGSVYVDGNNNAVRDGSESGISGVVITLTGTDASGNPVNESTTTDANGDYIIVGLPASNGSGYTLTETQPATWADGLDAAGNAGGVVANDVISAIVLNNTALASGYDFGELAGSFSGSVYIDTNNDGIQDIGELPIAGVTITLTGTDDLGNPISLTTTTDINGDYSFSGLRPGTYTLTETQPPIYIDGIVSAGSLGGTVGTNVISNITLASGEDGSDYNFAEQSAVLAGSVYVDKNENGIREASETGISGVTITLTGTDASGNPINESVTTDANGDYVFIGLPPSNAAGYTLTETQPVGWIDSIDTAGTAGGVVANDVISGIVLGGTTNASGYLFGEQSGSLSGSVFNDTNNNGLQDGTELPIEGVTITLTGTDDLGNPINLTTTTDVDGNYSFVGLRPGTYTLTETQPAIYIDGTVSVGNLGGTAGTNVISNITLTSGDDGIEYNFAERSAEISGSVYVDGNNNGSQDAGETGISAVVITITGTDASGNPVNETTTTNANGNYIFIGLPPANGSGYTLTETQPAAWADGLDAAGNAGGIVANDVISGILLNGTTNATGYTFGELSGSLSGSVFNDTNNNGLQDGSELPIENVTITLTGTDDLGNAVTLTTTTDANGEYSFTGLRPGVYIITETQPAIYIDGSVVVGSLGGTSGSNQITTITVASGDVGTEYNFAERSAQVAGSVYVDANNNGSQEAGETGISAVMITISGSDASGNAVNETTITDANGDFIFIGLPPSNANGYTLSETQPVGWIDGLDTAGSAGGTVANDTINGIILGGTTNATGYLFGELSGGLSGSVFNDSNNDGLRDATELPIENVTITLTGTDDLGNPINLITTTDVDGNYSFAGLRPGTYTLTETQPAIYVDGVVTAGSLGGTVGVNEITDIVIASGDDGIDYNFAERSAEVAGSVFVDSNGNGVRDGSESGISTVTINLTGTDATGNPINLVTTTDANGDYLFVGLPPSNASGYTLTETQPVGWQDGVDAVGTAGGVLANDVISGIVLTDTTVATAYTFGELSGSLSGNVFIDTNNDGIEDVGELPIENVTVTLTGTDDLGNPINLTTTTDVAGDYSFVGLRPGTYTLTETQPVIYQDGITSVGSLGGTVAPNVISDILLASGDVGIEYNFAERSGSIAGSVYVDSNNNGILDANEMGIANTTLRLTGIDDQGNGVNFETQTDANGNYIFAGLSPSDSNGYAISEVQPAAWADGLDAVGTVGGTVGNDLLSNIAVDFTTMAMGYNFGEVGGSLSGTVFNDLNNDGIQDPNEPGIPGVTLTLTGTDINGNPISITVITGEDGSYIFPDLPLPDASGYTITETQPADTDDGIVTAGSLGGTVGTNVITGIQLPGAGADGTGYNFAETSNAVAEVSGRVWLDTDHDRLDNETDTGREGWEVQLVLRDDPLDNENFTLIATVLTDSNGDYSFEGLLPGTDYEIRFLHPQGGYVYGGAISNEPGTETAFGTIRNLTLVAGANVIDQNLPLDPSGVVYDALTRIAVSAATVTLNGPAGFDAAIHLVGGTNNLTQITSVDGEYQFLLFGTAPAGTYTLTVVEPAGYIPGGSSMIPVCANTLNVSAIPDPALVQNLPTAPGNSAVLHDVASCPQDSSALAASADSTQYFLSFNLTPGVSSNVLSNHIPVDPVTEGAISVVKTSPKVTVSRGEMVPYSLRYTNNLTGIVANINLIDQIPPGFKYVTGSSSVDGIASEPTVNGRQLTWTNISFNPGQVHLVKMLLVVGTGVGDGEYLNLAWASNNIINQVISNQGSAKVRVIPDPTFDCTDLIGKVFDDQNLNGYQDKGEPGLAGVRVVSARGLLVTTDAEGRYHIACAAVANEIHGSNFILKLDERTLPSGYRVTTENPRVIHISRGKLSKLNFGAAIHSVVRVELSSQAFQKEATELSAETKNKQQQLLQILTSKASVLRLVYHIDGEDEDLVDQRLDTFVESLEFIWDRCDCGYELIIEKEKIRNPLKMPVEVQQGGADHE